MSSPPNVLLVVLDTVRAENTSLHCHVNDTTPFLREFADERATVYEQARAPAARSLDSHVSILTGLHVEEHDIVRSGDKLAPGHTVFEELRDEYGHATAVVSENNWLTDVDAGLKDAFETVEGPRDVPFPESVDPTSFVVEEGQGQYAAYLRRCLADDHPLRALANGVSVKLASDYPGLFPGSASTHGGVYVDLFLEWLDDREEPWAACLNLMDAHHPYEPAEEHDHWGGSKLRDLQDEIEDVKWEFNSGRRPWWQRAALEGLYDGAIRQLDAQLERLVGELERRDELDDTLLVITSDHGEGFGEPSRIRPGVRVASHSVSPHECILHVPLVVRYPDQSEPRRVSEPATLTNFAAAARRTVGREYPDDDKGDDDDTDAAADPFVPDGPVLATAHGLDDPVRERASRYCEDLSPYTATARAVFEPGPEPGSVRKYVTWRSRAVTIHVRDAVTSYVVSEDGGDRVRAAFADVEPAGVGVEGRDIREMDERSYRRLEDLGYV